MSDRRIDEHQIPDDERLGRKFADGVPGQSDDALSQLWSRHQDALSAAALRFCFGHRANADDAMQDLFIQLAKARATFKAERGTWVNWSCRVLQRLVLESNRKLQPKNFRFVQLAEEMSFCIEVPSPQEEDEHWDEFRERLGDCFSGLNEHDQKLAVLRWLDGLVVREIAEKTGMTQNQATHAVRRVHTNLKMCLEGKRQSTESES